MVFNVGKITPPGGDFMRRRGEFVINEIWGAISVSRGMVTAGWNILNFSIDSKNNAGYFGMKAFHTFSMPWFVTKVTKHVSDCSRNYLTNIVLCNTVLDQLSKTTEIFTGW